MVPSQPNPSFPRSTIQPFPPQSPVSPQKNPYDSLDRLVREKHTDYHGQTMKDATYGFDLAGNRTAKANLDGGGVAFATLGYTLGPGNRLVSWAMQETNLMASFPVVGSSSDPIGTNDLFGFLWVSNSAGQVVKPEVSGTNFWVEGMTVGMGTQTIVAAIRDVAGNMGYATNTFSLTVVTNGSYQYCAAGCLTNRQYTGKDNSDTLGLSWNGQYQLTGATTNGTVAEAYGYDGAGRRIFIAQGGSTNWMVYDGNQVVADLNATGGLVRSYVWGPGIDNLISMTSYGATTNTYYALKDHLGSVHALVNSAGQVVESYRYDAWGRVLGIYDRNNMPLKESAIGNRYLWQGREYSFKSGLYYFRARWYDPVTGRWLSNDPIGISGGLNQYVFCANNPVNFRDPWGLYSLYDDMADTAASGWSRGGISGSIQGNFYSGVTALLDTIGGQGVQSTAANSGAAAGRGDYRGAVAWGGATVGLVAMNASTFAFLKGAVVNSRQYLKNPILYDVGSGVLPKSVFRDVAHLSPVERGTYLLENYSAWERALLPLQASPLDYLAVLGQGPTTGGLLGALGLNLYMNQDGNCK